MQQKKKNEKCKSNNLPHIDTMQHTPTQFSNPTPIEFSQGTPHSQRPNNRKPHDIKKKTSKKITQKNTPTLSQSIPSSSRSFAPPSRLWWWPRRRIRPRWRSIHFPFPTIPIPLLHHRRWSYRHIPSISPVIVSLWVIYWWRRIVIFVGRSTITVHGYWRGRRTGPCVWWDIWISWYRCWRWWWVIVVSG